MARNNPYIREDEKIILALRSLYESFGYSQYKMVKFEEYDLYVRNKEFLLSEDVITFNDRNGKLMALKPDVTLSIIKNTPDKPGNVTRVYYNENVYRSSKSSRLIGEIMQTGIECLGDIDGCCITEVLYLAAKSLEAISENSVLCITDLDILTYAVSLYVQDEKVRKELFTLFGEKNTHGIEALCNQEGIGAEGCRVLCALSKLHGSGDTVFPALRELLPGCGGIDLFEETVGSLSIMKGRIEIDFAYAGDINYYNGIVFKGYIDGIPSFVLSGGRYDRLMSKMGKQSGAIGFAVYLDELSRLSPAGENYDTDIVLLYTKGASRRALLEKAVSLREDGQRVLTLKAIPDKLRYRQLVRFDETEESEK